MRRPCSLPPGSHPLAPLFLPFAPLNSQETAEDAEAQQAEEAQRQAAAAQRRQKREEEEELRRKEIRISTGSLGDLKRVLALPVNDLPLSAAQTGSVLAIKASPSPHALLRSLTLPSSPHPLLTLPSSSPHPPITTHPPLTLPSPSPHLLVGAQSQHATSPC